MKVFFNRVIQSTFFSLIIFCHIGTLVAQTAQTVKLGECIQLALDHSFQFEADSLLGASLQILVKQSEADYYPHVSGGLGVAELFLSPYTFRRHYVQVIADWDIGKFWYQTAEIQQKKSEQKDALMQENKLKIARV